MIVSMTGYGRGESILELRKATAELRSINSRHLEVSLRLSASFHAFELEVRELLRKRLGRGKISVTITEHRIDGKPTPIALSGEAVATLTRQLKEVAASAGLSENISLSDVLLFRDWLTETTSESEIEQVRGMVMSALEIALNDLQAMREHEGVALSNDVESKLISMEENLLQIDQLVQGNTAIQRQKLEARITEAGVNVAMIDPTRLTSEVALLLDKQDISEELSRLRSHIAQFRGAISAKEPTGKRLNFLSQEMHREANTIASKAGLIEITHISVKLRELIEQIREQVQNVE